MLKDNKRAYEHEQIMRDYDMVIKLNPGFLCTPTLTVRTCVAPSVIFRAAIVDYNEAIRARP